MGIETLNDAKQVLLNIIFKWKIWDSVYIYNVNNEKSFASTFSIPILIRGL